MSQGSKGRVERVVGVRVATCPLVPGPAGTTDVSKPRLWECLTSWIPRPRAQLHPGNHLQQNLTVLYFHWLNLTLCWGLSCNPGVIAGLRNQRKDMKGRQRHGSEFHWSAFWAQPGGRGQVAMEVKLPRLKECAPAS